MGVETRHVEQFAEQILDRAERGVELAEQLAIMHRLRALGEGRGKQARGVERLQQVVAGCGKKAGFADIGVFRLGLGREQLIVQVRKHSRALEDALLESLVCFSQRFVRVNALGHVEHRQYIAVTGHARAAHFQNGSAGPPAFITIPGYRTQRVNQGIDQFVDIARAVVALLGRAAQQGFERGSGARQFGRQLDMLLERAVPPDDL